MSRTESLVIRLAPHERALLDALVMDERKSLEEDGSPAHSVSMTSMVVALVTREAKKRGLTTKRTRRRQR